MILNNILVILLSCFMVVLCSKHQKGHKSKLPKSKPSPTQTHYKLPLSQVEIQTEAKLPERKPENSSSHLRSALDVLAPENDLKSNSEYASPLSMKTVTEKLHSESPRSSNGLRSTNASRSDVVFEVIDMEPYGPSKSRINWRFFILTGLYITSGLVSIIATYCIAKIIVARRKRHRQYMLLTKSDMDYHKGGGGI